MESTIIGLAEIKLNRDRQRHRGFFDSSPNVAYSVFPFLSFPCLPPLFAMAQSRTLVMFHREMSDLVVSSTDASLALRGYRYADIFDKLRTT